MRAIKNFFHNINDILLAIIVVALATGVIYWRMNIILNYPKQLAEEQAIYLQQDAEEAESAEAADAAESAEEDAEAEGSEDADAAESGGETDESEMEPQG